MAGETYNPLQPQGPSEDMLAMLGLHPAQMALAHGIAAGAIHPKEVLDAATPPSPAPAASPSVAGSPDGSGITPITPPVGSTADLEQRAARPKAIVPQVPSKLDTDQAELARLERTGSGLEQVARKHPILGNVARVAAGIGSALFPGIAVNIPGTDLHHRLLTSQAANRVAEDLGEQKEQAGIEESGARSKYLGAEAEAKLHPPTTVGKTPEEQTFASLLGQVNPDTGKLYTPLEAFTKTNQTKQDVKPEPHPPVGEPSAKQYNDSILRELNVNPKTAVKIVPPEYQVLATDTDAQAKEKLQRAKDLVGGATGQQRINVQTGNQGNARADRSYQFNSTQLEKLRQPIEQRVDRLSTLVANIDLKSPQADSVLAPEILSIVAGGQGSGLRMNEAEIARVIGGATKWTQLKTALNKWSLDPAHEILTDEQRGQMLQIAKVAQEKYQKKLGILNDAEQSLLESDDPKEHRGITVKAKKDLDAVDSEVLKQAEGGGQAAPKAGDVVRGYRFKGGDPSKKENWEATR